MQALGSHTDMNTIKGLYIMSEASSSPPRKVKRLLQILTMKTLVSGKGIAL